MGNHPVKNGFIAGGLLMALSMSFYFTDKALLIQFSALLEFVIIIYFMYKAVFATRIDNGGIMTFSEAFKPAWLTYILATTLSVLFTFILMNYIDPGLKEQVRELQIQAFNQVSEWFDISESDNTKVQDQMEQTDPYGLNSIAFSLPFSFILPGVLFASIMALVMRKEPPITQK